MAYLITYLVMLIDTSLTTFNGFLLFNDDYEILCWEEVITNIVLSSLKIWNYCIQDLLLILILLMQLLSGLIINKSDNYEILCWVKVAIDILLSSWKVWNYCIQDLLLKDVLLCIYTLFFVVREFPLLVSMT